MKLRLSPNFRQRFFCKIQTHKHSIIPNYKLFVHKSNKEQPEAQYRPLRLDMFLRFYIFVSTISHSDRAELVGQRIKSFSDIFLASQTETLLKMFKYFKAPFLMCESKSCNSSGVHRMDIYVLQTFFCDWILWRIFWVRYLCVASNLLKTDWDYCEGIWRCWL